MKPTFKIMQWTNEFIHPNVLINGKASKEELTKLQTGFLNQLRNYSEVPFVKSNFNKRKTLMHLRQLVGISNAIYAYLFHLSPVWKKKRTSSNIKSTYLNLLDSIERTIINVKQIEPEADSKLPITMYHNYCMRMDLNGVFNSFLDLLNKLSIEPELYRLVEKFLMLFRQKKNITQCEIDYITNLIKQIETSNISDTSHLVDLLYLQGFNTREFFHFYSNSFNNHLKSISSLPDQIQSIISEQDRLNGLLVGNRRMSIHHDQIDRQFKNFLLKKEKHLSEILNLRRAIVQDEQFSKTTSRLKIFLSVAQLGLLIRLFIEKGLLAKENIGELFTFFATHFSTPQTQYISSDSLRKKSTDVEFSTAQKLKGHLIGMLNWLNENYNLSNYKNS
ncbi:hypothetical protein SAMN05421827_102226 [Pedobacter terrae]|uniref:Uncharacterized protein n=1 Tax=Pedobacter terrae TaxID=405671 RepID=A0A1G7Q978_9SPHI|nr:hypothetical protein [Pedobacter terrae]SDF95091.1 hypothetical protein SAMN05421827_102226 [Pedobacter terrae]